MSMNDLIGENAMHKYLSCFMLMMTAGCMTQPEGPAAEEPKAESPVAEAETGKNVTEVKFMPCDVEALAKDPSAWNWNFRPYGTGTDSLWSDPKVQRDISSGTSADGRVTGLNVTCDANGATFLVYCNEPRLMDFFVKTNGYPTAELECFIQLGDADMRRVQDYHWFYYSKNDPIYCNQWIMESRHYRQLAYETSFSESVAGGKAIVAKIAIPWSAVWDVLPCFSDRKDNFWRFGCARWGGAGGVTYGGAVHEGMRAGYIRWPSFSNEQKLAIMKSVLADAWNRFNKLAGTRPYSLDQTYMDGEYLDKANGGKRKSGAKFRLEQNAKDVRSYVNYPEDPAFRPILGKLIAERKALAGEIAGIESLSPAAREVLYRRAADMLFNFRYDVEAAYSRYQKSRIMK